MKHDQIFYSHAILDGRKAVWATLIICAVMNLQAHQFVEFSVTMKYRCLIQFLVFFPQVTSLNIVNETSSP